MNEENKKTDNTITWTEDEFKEFDRLTLETSSPNQLTRISGRLDLEKFIEQHGHEKCKAMFDKIMESES